MATRVAIVPHTHWDREWYSPFQTFRMRLVKLLDALLPMLESDLSYARFLLDGQTAVIDDYLEIRPEAASVLTQLAAAGRLSIGPWMILMDEFMVSGETMVRDLQFGIARGTELGGVMDVGYLPDMFGHIAQMPQLLRLAGFEHAVVWRGVPSDVEHTAFWWESPDGSRVRAEYLYGSYSNGRDIPDDAKRLVLRAVDYEHELGSARLGDMLLMNGTDHQLPQPWLGRVVAEANAMQDDYEFIVTSLPEFVVAQPVDRLTTVRGELRSGARANLLMGVGSNRADVHRACAAAERAVEKLAEPLAALFLAPAEYPHALHTIAWRNLILNSAHDSSCACSHDEVVDQVLVRYAEARQIGEGSARDAVRALAESVDAPAGTTVVVNPTQRERSDVIEARIPGTGPCVFVAPDGTERPTQAVVDGEVDDGYQTTVTGQKVRWVLDIMRGTEFSGRQIAQWHIDEHDDAHEIVLREARPGEERCDLAELKAEMLTLGTQGRTMHVRLEPAPMRRVVFDTGRIEGFGWSCFTSRDGTPPSTAVRSDGPRTIANEHLRVDVAANGTYAIASQDGIIVEGLGRLVDDGDGGDTYNYSPPDHDFAVDHPGTIDVTVTESGPVRARIVIDARYNWPAFAHGNMHSCTRRSEETVECRVRTTLELRTGERLLRVRHEVDNHARDHRLRAHFPLPAAVTGSDAECAFAVVHRGLTAEGGTHEFGLPTFPSRRFVDASDGTTGLALVHDGLLEYEVVDNGRAIALTLLRAVGYLSRLEPQLRPNPAGPALAVEGPQMQGRQVTEYAVLPHHGDWRAADCYGAADQFLVPFPRTRVPAKPRAERPAAGSALRIAGGEVSAVLRVAGGLIVRVVRTDPRDGRVTIELDGAPARGYLVDLRGRPVMPFDGGVTLRPFEIATLQVQARSS